MLGREFPSGWNIPLREWTNIAVDWLVVALAPLFRGVADAVLAALFAIESLFNWLPWWSLVLLTAALVWYATGRRLVPTLLSVAALVLIGTFGLWAEAMTTLALMSVSTIVAVVIGLPLGVASARAPRLRVALRPILDVMQTMPNFVYLVPVVMLFGLGNVAAVFATVVYAVAPMVRLTDLGLRTVDESLIEAASTAGASELQTLLLVRFPLALPTLMAGVNQTIMLALSMVVLASMIGARGLGQVVLRGLQRGDVGLGLEAGIAIVVLAIILDRVTAGFAAKL
ncbi:MAG TPA: ABC transporter permease subunit [Trueperaceae bacterium]|nr:ABC transporter permease subunit [Trueperaceae bacterium]